MQVDDRHVRQAWEDFVGGRHIQAGVRDAVIESWKRSQRHRIDLEQKRAALVAEAELFRRQAENNTFLHAAQTALASSRHFLSEAGAMMILTDATGVIIETAGDERVIDLGHEIHAARGGRWNEDDTGTNGVGTALALGRPVQIHGSEHFCPEFQRWACAGSPVHHPADGHVMGAIVIAGMAAHFNPQSLALAVVTSQQVSAEVARATQRDHDVLLRHFLSKRARWSSDEFIMVDRRGLIVHASERGLRDVNRQNAEAICSGAMPFLKSAPFSSWRSRINDAVPNAGVELVEQDGDGIGAIVVLHNRRRSAARSSSRTMATMAHTEKVICLDEIRGESPAIREAKERVLCLSESGAPVLVTGETGVGKELFARAIHGLSDVASGPFVPVNCGALPRELIASELFGYVKGAFTGARDDGRVGKVEAADNGVLCLDEIGELPLEMQPFLLRVLEDGIIYRVGSNEPRQVNLRLIAMTNRDLRQEVEARRFRSDLYYRLGALQLRIPALRERGDDILLLTEHFLREIAGRQDRQTPRLSDEVEDALLSYSWPGNVRELRNAAEHMLLSRAAEVRFEDLPQDIRCHAADGPMPGGDAAPMPHLGLNLKYVERGSIEAAIRACGGNLTRAAKQLGIARSTLYLRLAAYEGKRPNDA